MSKTDLLFEPHDTFVRRHIGPSDSEIDEMLASLGVESLEALTGGIVPRDIQLAKPLAIGDGRVRGEQELLDELRHIAAANDVRRSLIGCGYYGCITPPVIQRNILENPGWYTQYTPYQAEISQGRLEALVNFQTMVADLTGLPLSGASLLDEATAAAEAMAMCWAIGRHKRTRFVVDADTHPQTVAVIETRAAPLGIDVVVSDVAKLELSDDVFGVLVSYPGSCGQLRSFDELASAVHDAGALLCCATDLLALALLRPPGEFGADIAFGSSQRFGVPLGFGGPHAAFLSTREEFKRQMPGRIIGASRDAHGHLAYRLALQTREQHIRRERATSNICTAQVLLAIMAGMYGVYHGPRGLRRIAERVHGMTALLARGLRELGFQLSAESFFDTLEIVLDDGAAKAVTARADAQRLNLRRTERGLALSLDELTNVDEVESLWRVVGAERGAGLSARELATGIDRAYDARFARASEYLTHEVFNSYHAEHELLRYITRLQARDLSLTTSMIPLGSCTMKLNATSEMLPVTWADFGGLHPFVPAEQAGGYARLCADLERWLAELTGFAATSLQPNAGAQGEYAGLLVIRAYHHDRGATERDVCLIPVSAHGTNPASAVMAGMKVVIVNCDEHGNIDVDDLRAKAEKHRDSLAALMVTYPSTHGVFEERIAEICQLVHDNGGQVYMDGANMNAQVGLCRPGDYGADVCHLNLHKTFCIPHGGGGPGMGPICVASHLAPYLPSHPLAALGGDKSLGTVSAAPWGSPSILPIPWVYIALMGADGLRRATEVAILNANYMAERLRPHYPVLYSGRGGRVAHEFIIDLRELKKSSGVTVDDVAKRLMDFGFHAPTMSFPVAGTLMVEPTESESKGELDRFCEAMITIREEIRAIEAGELDRDDNPLRNAPHTAQVVTADAWPHPYSREQAAYPAPWLRQHKFWPPVGRVDNAYGDRNLVCTCPPIEAYEQDA
ncbi:MAG: aminomethyl-transferring glycine dehydrogenase [Myxococcales bacterium]|nr:aminomethyl-transferring glycine dehydrogenase [Myxococcales bacterium]